MAVPDRDTFERQSSLMSSDASNSQQGGDKKSQRRLYLPLTFEPGNWDVICHNGREFQEHGKCQSFKT